MKDFSNWNTQKQNIQNKEKIPYFHEREIWYISLWVNIWVEQDGKWEDFCRPIVILKKLNRHSFYALPLTSVDKTQSIHHIEVSSFESDKRSFASLSQLRITDSKRLLERKGMLPIEDYKKLLQKIKELFS